MDYIIADKTVIPEKNKKFFTEKIIYLPNSYQPSEKNRPISNKLFSKEDLNLPEKILYFVVLIQTQNFYQTQLDYGQLY